MKPRFKNGAWGVAERRLEISQTRSVWGARPGIYVLKGRWFAAVPSGRMTLGMKDQPPCGWLISGCPVGTLAGPDEKKRLWEGGRGGAGSGRATAKRRGMCLKITQPFKAG